MTSPRTRNLPRWKQVIADCSQDIGEFFVVQIQGRSRARDIHKFRGIVVLIEAVPTCVHARKICKFACVYTCGQLRQRGQLAGTNGVVQQRYTIRAGSDWQTELAGDGSLKIGLSEGD